MDRNFEQEYKKAFEAAKGLHDAGNALTKKQMEIVFPQLAESEDKRIARAINNMLPFIPDEAYANNGVTKEDVLTWLEKQKEQKPAEWSEEDEKMLEGTLMWLDDLEKQGEYVEKERLWLKSIRPVSKESLQSWKPSEDQMKALLNAEGYLRAGDQFDSAKKIAELYEQLKRL